jgi:hypothetical protein
MPILTNPKYGVLDEAIAHYNGSTYHMLSDGFSSIQASSGSALIFSTSTVARYAAKPVSTGETSALCRIVCRALDLIPALYQRHVRGGV